MASEQLQIDIAHNDIVRLISLYIKDRTSEATRDLIASDFPEITIDNVKDVAYSAMINEMVIHVLEQYVEYERLDNLNKIADELETEVND